MKLIATEYDSLCRSLRLRQASAAQQREMRRAFYAGASTLFSVFLERLADEKSGKDEILDLLTGIQEELVEFGDAIKRGVA